MLRILEKKEIFYNEARAFIEYLAKKHNCSIEKEFIQELINLQKEGINPIDEQAVDLSKIKDKDVGVNFDELFKEMGLDEDD